MIFLGDLYYIIVAVYLLQLYQNCSRLLGHIYCSSSLGHLLGHFLRYPLGHPLGHLLRHPLGHPLGHFLGHPIQAQNCYLCSRA